MNSLFSGLAFAGVVKQPARPAPKPGLRFAQHLSNDRDALFLFLDRLDVEATNWPAEHAIRPAVINRKTSGGNRSDPGAAAQAILTSIIQTCHQQGTSSLEAFKSMLRHPIPTRYPIAPGLR
ncbi:MAG: IS66 family transposase [Thermoanaerobaculia bacterium]